MWYRGFGGAIVLCCAATVINASEVGCAEANRYDAPEAVQGVAVDDEHFYAIANSVIAKYHRPTGGLLIRWAASRDVPLKHLNAGVVRDNRLYCAHSNYPEFPATSSIEVFDCDTLEHVESHSFGIYEGSLTAVDWHDGAWWCVFAHYSKKVNDDPLAKPHTYTSLVKFDSEWRRLGGWVFPEEVLDRFSPHSCSGAVWGSDGVLYCTGHDLPEVYRLVLPRSGSKLKLLSTERVPFPGQGIACERGPAAATQAQRLWGIIRPERKVVAVELRTTDNALRPVVSR
jgi:hypothetical protein